MAQHRAPEPRYRNAAVALALALIGVLASTGIVSAATSNSAAACTKSDDGTTETITCPSTQTTTTVTATITSPGPTVTQTVTATATVTASPSSTAPTSATPTPTPSPTSSRPGSGFPDATNTGPVGTLTVRTGNVTVAAGATLANVDIAGSVTLGAGATLANSHVRCENESNFCVSMGSGSTLSQDEIGGGANGTTRTTAIGVWTGGPGNTIQGTEIHLTSDGIRADGGTTISDSFIHDLDISGHSDGSQTDAAGGQPVVFQHDTIWGGTNDAVFDDQYGTASITVNDCLLMPDQTGSNRSSYGVYVYRAEPAVVVTNSTFGRGWQVAPIQLNHGGTVSGNTWTDGTPLS